MPQGAAAAVRYEERRVAKIGFLGTGSMGRPMATRLLEAGHDVTVWNRTPERAEPLTRYGAAVAGSPAEAAQGSEFVVTMLADGPAVEDVLFREDGVVAGMSPGTLLVEMSTIGPAAVQAIREGLPHEVDLIDARVMGSTPRAEAGELVIVVGGSEEAFQRARDVLEVLGKPRRVGGLGAGAALKLVMNSTLGPMLVAIGEGLALGRALGLDQRTVLEAMEAGYLGALVKLKRQMIETGRFPAQFKLSLAAKDLGLAADAGREAGVELRGLELTRRLLEQATAAGLGDQDYAALIAFLDDRAGGP
jgi:3-hydroxyisobutyrate dehydrogenase-like beta-hydroxyacid dehydrogenase